MKAGRPSRHRGRRRWQAEGSRRPEPSSSGGPGGHDGPVRDLDSAMAMLGDMPAETQAMFARVVANVVATRARAPEEALKASAPCNACGRIMLAAERCPGCVAGGAWYCRDCHARLEGEASMLGLG